MKHNKLLELAQAMRKNARAPYSNYTVGASVQTETGEIIGGCNVESSSYGLTCCAERSALYNAVSLGFNNFTALAVASKNGAFPCGACRQVIWELCGDIPIIIIDEKSKLIDTTSQTLLPNAFDDKKLK